VSLLIVRQSGEGPDRSWTLLVGDYEIVKPFYSDGGFFDSETSFRKVTPAVNLLLQSLPYGDRRHLTGKAAAKRQLQWTDQNSLWGHDFFSRGRGIPLVKRILTTAVGGSAKTHQTAQCKKRPSVVAQHHLNMVLGVKALRPAGRRPINRSQNLTLSSSSETRLGD